MGFVELLKDAYRNLIRRRLRTVLAVLGVAVGVFSFLLMGAMAEHFQRIARQFDSMFKDRVIVCERPSFWAGGGILSQEKARKVAKISGVGKAIPLIVSRLQRDQMVVVGVPSVVVGVPLEDLRVIAGDFPLRTGSRVPENEGEIIIGSDIAGELGVSLGGAMRVEGENFKITGIYKKTGALIDNQAFISLEKAQKILQREGLVTSIMVIPEANQNSEDLSSRIKAKVGGVEVIPPSKFRQKVRSGLLLWNSITMASGAAASLAGALCIMIIMLVSVSERYVEIGIMKAVGADEGYIIRQFFAEAFLLTLFGWLAGSLLVAIFSGLFGGIIRDMGADIFSYTPRLFAFSLVGALVTGVVSTIFPAYRISRIEPVEALKVRY